MAQAPTSRLHVIWRPGAPRAVIVLKRARAFATFGWELGTDEVHLGQWLKSKLYFRRCDLSADGELWGYFVLNGRRSSVTRDTYTVLARPPWLKALLLWPQGGTWGGGLRFSDSYGFELVRQDGQIDMVRKSVSSRGLLERSGWAVEAVAPGTRGPPISYRRSLSRRWSLLKLMPRHEAGAERHVAECSDGRVVTLEGWDWADLLDDGRLAWSHRARLYAVPLATMLQRFAEGEALETGEGLVLDASAHTYTRRTAPYDVDTVFIDSGDDGPFRVPPISPR